MIRVAISICPPEGYTRTIVDATISNVTPGRQEADYHCEFVFAGTTRTLELKHDRDAGIVALVKKAIDSFSERFPNLIERTKRLGPL